MTKGKKNEVLSDIDYKVDTIANAVKLVKAWITLKAINGVIQNKNGEIISSNIDKATN